MKKFSVMLESSLPTALIAVNTTNISSTTLASALTTQVRQDIIKGVFAPGSRLRTKELAERYGTSLIPMREALSRLASSGFVKAEDQRGFSVPPVSKEELSDITQTRIYIETEALRRSIEHGDLTWESALIAAHHRLSRLPIVNDAAAGIDPEWEQAHLAFHRTLLAACDSPWLLNLAQLLRDQTARYRHLSVQPDTAKATKSKAAKRDIPAEHQAIVDAAVARDATRACELLRQHFMATTNLALNASSKV